MERELLRMEEDRHVFVLTEKGLKYLHVYDSLERLTDEGLEPQAGRTQELAGDHVGL